MRIRNDSLQFDDEMDGILTVKEDSGTVTVETDGDFQVELADLEQIADALKEWVKARK